MSALFQLGEILKYWESPNQIYNTTIRIWHRFGLPQKYRYIYIYNCLDWRTEVSKSYLDSVVESDVARRRQQTYCVYFKKAGTLKPNFNAFCYERISIFQQQKYPHNVRIWLVQWWWDQENMMFKKVSAGVHNCKKKKYFTKHSTPIQLENQNCIEKIVVEFFYLMICDYSNLPHLYSDISGVIFLTITTKSTKHPTKTGSVRWCPSLSTTRCLASNELVTSSGRPTGSGCGRRWQEGGCFTMDWMPKLTIKLHGGEGFRCTDAKARCLNDVSTQWIVHEYKSYE